MLKKEKLPDGTTAFDFVLLAIPVVGAGKLLTVDKATVEASIHVPLPLFKGDSARQDRRACSLMKAVVEGVKEKYSLDGNNSTEKSG